MSDPAAAAAVVPSAESAPAKSPKKKTATKAKNVAAKKPSDHPKYNDMIRQALVALKERGGSSRQAILKYIMAHFKVGNDEHVVNQHLKVALKSGVKSDLLKQSKGSGASGSFRLGADAKKEKPAKKEKKAKSAAAVKKPSTKKATTAKKSPKKAAAAKKPAAAKKAKATGDKPKAKKAAAAGKPKKAKATAGAAAGKPKKAKAAATPKKAKAAAPKKAKTPKKNAAAKPKKAAAAKPKKA